MIWILLAGFCAALQYRAGAIHSELGMESDGPAHYVTALMVRDYVAQGFHGSIVAYAENYYAHYPKVAIGHWPPMFYLLGGAWMLVFPPTPHSLIVFMMLLGTVLAATLQWVVGRRFGDTVGVVVGLLFLAIPLVQAYTGAPMVDLPVALFSFLAALLWARYLKSEGTAAALLFTLFAVCGILTKGTGLAVVGVPVVSVTLTRKFWILLRWRTWMSAGIIMALYLPWQLATVRMVTTAMQYNWGWGYSSLAIPFYLKHLVLVAGLAVSLAAVVGIWAEVIRPSSAGKPVEAVWASLGGLLLGSVLLVLIVPSGLETRLLLAAVPPVVAFAAVGIEWTAAQLRRRGPLARLAWRQLLWIAVAAAFAGGFSIPAKFVYGFGEAAQDIVDNGRFSQPRILCSSDANGEGMLITEIAARERRPGHFVMRASKLLARSDWNGRDYQLLCDTPEKALRYLRACRIGVLVLDCLPSPTSYAHSRILQQMVRNYPQIWRPVGVYPKALRSVAPGARVEVYQMSDFDDVPAQPVDLDLTHTLRTVLRIPPG